MATSNETFGVMKPSEELVVRCTQDGRGMYWFVRPVGQSPRLPVGATAGGTIPTIYTSAATMATAIQNALPTLES